MKPVLQRDHFDDLLKDIQQRPTNTLYHQALFHQGDQCQDVTNTYHKGLPDWAHVKSILDVGCGSGSFVAYNQSLLEDKYYLGIDINDDLLAFAKTYQKKGKVEFQKMDILKETLPQKFDCLFLRFCLQHIPDVKTLMSQLDQHLGDEGMLIIHETMNERQIVAIILGSL